MNGTDPGPQRPLAVQGSEHVRLEGTQIEEIRRYWTFDAEKLDTGFFGYPYGDTK